jgi:hypothetical protein
MRSMAGRSEAEARRFTAATDAAQGRQNRVTPKARAHRGRGMLPLARKPLKYHGVPSNREIKDGFQKDFEKLRKTSKDFQRLPKTSKNFQKFPPPSGPGPRGRRTGNRGGEPSRALIPRRTSFVRGRPRPRPTARFYFGYSKRPLCQRSPDERADPAGPQGPARRRGKPDPARRRRRPPARRPVRRRARRGGPARLTPAAARRTESSFRR